MKRAICLIALAGTAIAVGCGDDESAPDARVTTPTVEDTSTEISKEELITGGDGVCAEVNAALGGLESSDSDPAIAAGQRADLYDGMVERMRDLGTPDDDAGLDEVFDAGDDLVASTAEAADAAEEGDVPAWNAVQDEISTASESFAGAAGSYGFDDCGQGSAALVTTRTSGAIAAPSDPAASAAATPEIPVAPAPAPAPDADPGTTGSGGGTTGVPWDYGAGDGASRSGGVGPAG